MIGLSTYMTRRSNLENHHVCGQRKSHAKGDHGLGAAYLVADILMEVE
jgi:hypothetical protein